MKAKPLAVIEREGEGEAGAVVEEEDGVAVPLKRTRKLVLKFWYAMQDLKLLLKSFSGPLLQS